jgi:hypothetical protein
MFEGPKLEGQLDIKGWLSGTLHVYWTPRVRGAADAQLPVAVVPPALDPASSCDDARVCLTRGYGFSGDT